MTAQSLRIADCIQLISAPRDTEISPISRSGAYQPIGLLSIASYLLDNEICSNVEILDGEFLSEKQIESRIVGDIIGISCTTPSYQSALHIAQVAKSCGATVVLGGPHATALAVSILKNRPEIDFIVRGDGEVAFANIVQRVPPSKIPNLSYRESKKIMQNPIQLLDLSNLPIIKREILPLEPYFDRYAQQATANRGQKPAAIFTHKGCQWRDKSNGCLFCGRLDKSWRSRPTTQVWHEISDLNQNWGANYIWDVSDSFTSSSEWVQRFADDRPSSLDVDFFVYARSNELDLETVEALQTIGCKEVFIGVESGSNPLLQNANKGTTVQDNLRAARLLDSYRIKMFPCFIFGLPGESPQSLEETIQHAEDLSRICEWSTVSASVLVPLPGSRAYRLLLQNAEGYSYLAEVDAPDLEFLGQLWINTYCDVSWEAVHEAIGRILDLSPNKSSFFNFQHKLESRLGVESLSGK